MKERWKIKITIHGPALFDANEDCHGSVSLQGQYQNNGNVYDYVAEYCQKNRVDALVNVEDILEMMDDSKLNSVYFCERKSKE